MKKIDEEHVEKRVAFEVSVSKLELLGTEEKAAEGEAVRGAEYCTGEA